MFHDMDNFQQEVEAKQARFQAQATQERMVKTCANAGQSRQIIGRPEKRRLWLLLLGFKLMRQPK